MNSSICSKCAQSFATPAKFAAHMRRKTSCVSGFPGEMRLNTFIQLYAFLAGFPGDSIIPWLEKPWNGKDKQESLLRIFAFLGVIPEFDGYTVCTGNFNIGDITPVSNIRDLFYHPTGGAIMLKDSGDASDLTLRLGDMIIATTSKNFSKYTVNKLDITKIKDGFNNPVYANTRQRLCIVIRRRDQLADTVTNAKKTSASIVAYINDPTTIILDWVDLDNAFRRFKIIYSHRLIDSIFDTDMPRIALALRPHQLAAVAETKIIKESGATDALWGHVPRSGKSYIMAAFIADDAKYKDTCNYLIITTAPNETIEQYESILRCEDLRGVNVLRLPRDSAENLGVKNIIICSKQYLQTKFDVADAAAPCAPPLAPSPKKGAKSKALPPKQNRSQKSMYSWLSATPKIKVVPELAWLAALSIDVRFVDESHLGGSTDLAQQTLACFGNGKFTVFITATYSKPADAYAIPRNRWVTWDLDDIAACKQFASPCADTVARAQSRIFDKHPHSVDIFKQCDPAYIAATYNTYPELTILTHEITDDVIAEMRASADNTYGWSAKACLLLKQSAQTGKVTRVPEFQNEPETVKMIHTLFGAPPDTFGRRLGAKSFMERAADICNNANADPRFMRDPRAFPDTDPTIVIAFLPAMDIDTTSTALQNLIERRGLLPEYDVCIINSKQSGDPKTRIESARVIAKNAGKRAVLVLSGRQCSLGVTLHGCDVAILLNATDDNDGSDMIYQMMFRSMTEAVGKKYGFVFDMDIQRAMRTVVCNQTHPVLKDGKTYREFIAYLLRERIVSLNPDHWEERFGHSPAIREPFFARVYLAYSAQPDRIIKDILDCVKLKSDLLTRNNCALLRAFGKLTKKSVKRVSVRVMRDKRDSMIPDGIEKTAIEKADEDTIAAGDDADDADEDDDEFNGLSPDEMIRHIIPTVVLLTIDKHTTTLRQMITEIEKDAHIWEILMDRTRAWWEHLGTREMLFLLIGIHEEHITSIDRTVDMTIDSLKDVFVEHIDCAAKLSGVIDRHLVPLETEKKAHAEVSTPAQLRKEMLDTIPPEFWTKPRRVLEPCAGKGGFLVDIVDRFMRGLEPSIPDADERRRVIVEECLYWADINPFNVWVCSFLLNLKGTYRLNGYLGDSLTLDVATQWDVTGGFDAVIGNPPYSTDPSLKDTRPLYNIFVEKYIDATQYLLFVIPSRWFVGGKGLDEFREFMTKRTDIALITHEDNATKWFGSCVDIKGGTHYFLKDSTYNGLCLFNGVPYMLSKYDCVIKPQHHILVDKCAIIPSIDLLYCSSQHFKYRNNDPAVKPVGNTVCFVSTLKSKNRKQYVSDFVFNDVNTFWKVLTLRAAHKAFSGFGAIFVARPDEVYTDSYFAFKVPDETSANSLVSYLQTAFANHMLSIRKISHNTSKDTCKWIPLVPLDRIWTDALVCDHFSIDPASYTK